MGKGKSQGGGVQTPKIPILPDFNVYNQNVFQPLGTFGAQETIGLSSLANWASDIATGGNVQTGVGLPANGIFTSGNNRTFAPFTAGGGGGGGTGTQSAFAGIDPSLLGPFLSNAVLNLENAQGATGLLSGLIPQINALAGQFGATSAADTAKGGQMLQQATTGKGLYPSQAAYINQAVKSQQAAIAQQLSNEGLGSSTLMGSLQGQAKMSGAAAAGQLIQGNISAAEAEQQIGLQAGQLQLDTTQLSVAAQEALFSQFSSIATMSAGLQAQLWGQAMQGYGEMGQMLNSTVNAFGYGLKTQEDIQNAAIQQASIAAQANQTNASLAAQQAQSSASMFAGLGQLLGGGGSSGGLFGGSGSGGLLGGLGGLLGSFGATSPITGTVGGLEVAGGATAGTGLLGSLGGALGGLGSGIGAAIGVLFSSSCTAGRGLPGINDIRWVLFRDWILYRSPRLVRTLYVRHCELINRTIAERDWLRKTILFLIDQVVTHDQNTRTT